MDSQSYSLESNTRSEDLVLSTMLPTVPWYSVFVQTGYEDKIRAYHLEKLCPHLTFMIPKRQLRQRQEGLWKEILKPIFPGYILVKGCMNYNDCYAIRRIHHVMRVLCDQTGEPSRIHPSEISILLKLLENGEIIRPSKAIDMGDRIEIIEGPLKAVKGIVHSINQRKGRARIILSFLNKERKVDVSLQMVRLAEKD
ncbi:MAG: antiterminator LoaP [Caldisericia bacterium]|nr:antiterminator LoaP [Caldisericia bacterium]MDD4614068.1 antiterminator LoaP [Caldisericia bacterium]